MDYEWDVRKNEINIAKHGIDFADAHRILQLPLLVEFDDRFEYGEDRWTGLGVLASRVVQIVYTEPDEQTRRIISVRKVLPHERKQYEQFLKTQF